VRSEARAHINRPPSKYLDRFYYDCLTHSEPVLRYMIDSAGIDRIFLGSDWPYDMGIDSPVEWINGLESLTREEKDAILWKNLERVLGL
jgi:aminocarboxymuconate-semialdehyde decarboxylase